MEEYKKSSDQLTCNLFQNISKFTSETNKKEPPRLRGGAMGPGKGLTVNLEDRGLAQSRGQQTGDILNWCLSQPGAMGTNPMGGSYG